MRAELTFAEAVRDAIHCCMSQDEKVFIIGEGVPDPKGIFGTTAYDEYFLILLK